MSAAALEVIDVAVLVVATALIVVIPLAARAASRRIADALEHAKKVSG